MDTWPRPHGGEIWPHAQQEHYTSPDVLNKSFPFTKSREKFLWHMCISTINRSAMCPSVQSRGYFREKYKIWNLVASFCQQYLTKN